jgi:putative FmdB family regulatory protein
MPTYHYQCDEHGIFELSLPLRKWSDRKPCPKCEKESEQVLLPQQGRGEFANPVVIHVSADGQNFRFPGAPDARIPDGFVKKELKTIREIESFERQFNAKLRSDADRHHEHEEREFSQIRARLRSELRQRMQHMSPAGRDFAEFAMKHNDNLPRKKTDCGFHVAILHFDASQNPQIDKSTGWKKRYV